MTLREKQSAFARCLGQLIAFVYSHPGWELTMADGAIDYERKYRAEPGGAAVKGYDAQHMNGSLHYVRLAQDLNLFVGGKWIKDGAHPAWAELGRYWEATHGLARWGGRFKDSNHFSFEHGGKQ